MNRLTENKIVVVSRKTRLDELIVRFNTIEQAKFYVEHLGADFEDYMQEHKTYQQVLSEINMAASALGRVQQLDRDMLADFIFGPDDTIVVVGQDGLVVNTMKYLDQQPVVAINPDPKRWNGVLLPFAPFEACSVIFEVLKGKRSFEEVTMAEAVLNDGQKLYAVNDFYIGQKTHVSARYKIDFEGMEESHSSSGVIVSTGIGATGWLTSVLNGVEGFVKTIFNKDLEFEEKISISHNSDFLYFMVREPFPGNFSSTDIVFGKVEKDKPLKLTSEMGDNGVIFSDGIESDYLSFNSGVEAVIKPADKKGRLVV